MGQSIPLVDLKAQYQAIQPEVDGAIQRILDTTSFILGPDVREFEEAFAQFCGATHCVGVSSGTSALELTLRAYGIGPGDEVITVAHTFIATAEAISTVGATPLFVEIDPRTYTLDPDHLTSAITDATRAVIPVDIYGQPANSTRINEIAQQHDLIVISDAAQAHGATWQTQAGEVKRAGTLTNAACFSFYPGKNLGAYGDAGAVVTNETEIAERVRRLRNHGRQDKYVHEEKGFGERLDTLQAAILLAKLPYLEEWTAKRRRLASRYSELLSDYEIELPHVAAEADPAWHLYVIRTPQRDAMLDFLRAKGIGAGIHYPIPLHLQPAYADVGLVKGDLPVTEIVAETCLSLPIYPEMTDAQQARVVDAIGEFLNGG